MDDTLVTEATLGIQERAGCAVIHILELYIGKKWHDIIIPSVTPQSEKNAICYLATPATDNPSQF